MAPLATPTSSSSSPVMKPTLRSSRTHPFKKPHHHKHKLIKHHHHKKINHNHNSSSSSSSSEATTSTVTTDNNNNEETAPPPPPSSSSSSCCSTPKGEKFRIPDISTCPPAPKKKLNLSTNNNHHFSPISFFAPPDLELFFFLSLPT
ncbi:Cyclin-dependent protein kinase inhibitor SMR13 [Senna tora]|uniref:Cyclin-dependent protein kinase inhibitor SMR13 n=1 Tax=Senna tora TaxID=362788 RepID=A0A834TF31_9FABA|nr:Cyclin-dependent protein kinase inhibitor SMR13 [Senna tora]